MSRPAGSVARSSAASTTTRASARSRRGSLGSDAANGRFHIAWTGARLIGSRMIPVPRSIARIPILRGIFRVGLTSWARWTRGRYMVDERMGLRLLLDHDNIVDRGIFLTGTWEKEHLDALFGLMAEQRRHFDGDAVFLDIGAHWGLY